MNLDNILQSECILPFNHYSQRKTGSKMFMQIEELRAFDKSIVLFDYPVKFTINDTNNYNFPILIEFEDDCQTQDIKYSQEGILFCNHTLFLTPWNCRIYFFSEQAYNLVIINTKDNKTIKYYANYNIFSTVSNLNLKQIPQKIKNPYMENGTRFEDNIIDKQKGVIYAYLLGEKISVNHQLAVQNKLSQVLYNMLTNLISMPSYLEQENMRNNLINSLDEYKSVDVKEIENKKRYKEEKNDVLDKLKHSDECTFDCEVMNEFISRWNDVLLPEVSKLKRSDDFAKLRSKIDRRTTEVLYENQEQNRISLESLSLLGDSVCIKDTPLVNIVLSYIIKNDVSAEILLYNKKEFYMRIMNEGIVEFLRDCVQKRGEKWEDSSEQKYINNLYLSITKTNVPFKLDSINNEELKAIAAFVLKGHDFSIYREYLKMNEVEDYRYYLAIWGALCGYMEMNKDVLKYILSEKIHKKIYSLLTGKDIFILNLSYNTKDSEIEKWRKERREFVKWNNGKKISSKKLELLLLGLECAFLQIGSKMEDDKLVEILLEYDGWKTSSRNSEYWVRFQKQFAPNYVSRVKSQQKRTKKKIPCEGSLFNGEEHNQTANTTNVYVVSNTLYFYNAPDTIKCLCDFVGETAINEIVWFFDDLQKNSKDRKYYQKIDVTNNKFVIDTFCKSERIRNVIGKTKLEEIRFFFYKKYGIR